MSCITAPNPGIIESANNHALSQPPPADQGAASMTAASSATAPESVDHSTTGMLSQSQSLSALLGAGSSLPNVGSITTSVPEALQNFGAVSDQSQSHFGILPSPSPMMSLQPSPAVAPAQVLPTPSFAQMPPQAPSVPGYGDFFSSAGLQAGGLYNGLSQSFGQYAMPPTLQTAPAQVYGQFAQTFTPTGALLAPSPTTNSSSGSGAVCKHYLAGRCNYGSSCKFSHETDAPGAGVSPLGIYSGPGSLICKHWLSGRCTYPDCKFKHEGAPGGGGISAAALTPTPLVSPIVGYSPLAVTPSVGFSSVPSSPGTIRSSPY